MAIKSLFRDYVQKSGLFLYPALDIERGGSVTPIETYISWENHYEETDYKLICLYHLRDDTDFRSFEKLKLLGNPKFHNFKQVESEEGEKGIYVFDFSGTNDKNNWDNFLIGHYSQFTKEHKNKIQTFFGNTGSNYPYIESYLYPEKYYTMYAEILAEKRDRGKMEESLRHAHELCDKPIWELEKIVIMEKDLEIKKYMS